MYMSSKGAVANIGFNSSSAATSEFLNLSFAAGKVEIFGQPSTCTFPSDQPFPVEITLTVTASSATALIGVAGTVANFTLHECPSTFSAVTFYQEAGDPNVPFDVTDVVVTYTPL
jgi:hypothetical protein